MKTAKWFSFLSLGVFFITITRILFLEKPEIRPTMKPVLNEGKNKYMQQRMAERIARIEQACLKEEAPNKTTVENAKKIAWHMTEVLKKHRLLVCVVHKAGSSTWNTIAARLYDKEDLIKSEDTHVMVSVLKTRSYISYRRLSKSRRYRKILMARNPFDRVLSAFLNRVVAPGLISDQAKTYVPEVLFYNRGIRFEESDVFDNDGRLKIFPTFSEFINYLVTLNPETYDPHWIPVSIQCGVCKIKYDAVLLTETLSEDLQYIMMMSGLDKKVNPSLALEHRNKAVTDTRKLLATYYSTLKLEILKKFIEIYHLDFSMFNYDPNAIFDYISFNETDLLNEKLE